MAIEMKPFDRNDWYMFIGLEEPSNGEPCLIGHAAAATDWPPDEVEEQLVVIIDASGVGIHGMAAWLFKSFGYDEGKAIVAGLCEPISMVDLLAAGWEPNNFPDSQEVLS